MRTRARRPLEPQGSTGLLAGERVYMDFLVHACVQRARVAISANTPVTGFTPFHQIILNLPKFLTLRDCLNGSKRRLGS